MTTAVTTVTTVDTPSPTWAAAWAAPVPSHVVREFDITALTGRPEQPGLLRDFAPKIRQAVIERVETDGIHAATMYYRNQLDRLDQRIAGRLELAKLYQEGPQSFEEYLLLMRPLMRKITSQLAVTTPVTLDPTSREFRWRLFQMYKATTKVEKLDAPNETWQFLWANRADLSQLINFDYDLRHDHQNMSVFRNTYLTRQSASGRVIELPQYMYLRIATQMYGDYGDYSDYRELTNPQSLQAVIAAYHGMAKKLYVPASPTIFNAGKTVPQMSSCFLQRIYDDMGDILYGYHDIGMISKCNGANGVFLGDLRTHTPIGNSGLSAGTKSVMKQIDNITGDVDQGGNRPGATNLANTIWHFDVLTLIKMVAKTEKPHEMLVNAHASIALYDLFIERSDTKGSWSLFCPTQVPMLLETFGAEFEKWYLHYESLGIARAVVNARELHTKIEEMRKKFGFPFLYNWDNINRKTNQENIGIVVGLNLCMEVALVADHQRIPSCNLSSTVLPAFAVTTEAGFSHFDWAEYGQAVRTQVRNLNRVIERNYHPLPQIEFSNQEAAPIGIGMQGFADLLAIMDLPFDSPEAMALTEKLAACAYFNAMYESMLIAKERGYPYKAFQGSPFSRRIFQFDMWAAEDRLKGRPGRPVVDPQSWAVPADLPQSWDALKDLVQLYGVANSQLTVMQPTASCAQLTGSSEACEPYYHMLFVRKTAKGEMITINRYMQADFERLGLWSGRVIAYLRHMDGSIQGIHEIFPTMTPEVRDRVLFLERKYRTAFEIKQKVVIDHALCRGRYIDGSQSMSTYWVKPNVIDLMRSDIYASRNGAKTVVYYTRSTPERTAAKFTLETSLEELYQPLPSKEAELGTRAEPKRDADSPDPQVNSQEESQEEPDTGNNQSIDYTSVDAPFCTTLSCT